MARKLYPMPVDGILHHPDFLAMPAAGAGILFRLVLHFWQTECRPLPVADHELRSIARAHAPTWRHWKSHVLRVFDAVRPAIEGYYVLRLNKGTTLSRLGQLRQSRQRLAALQKSHPAIEPVPSYALGFVPKRDPMRRIRLPASDNRSRRAGVTDGCSRD